MPERSDVTNLLNSLHDGDGKAPEQLLPLVYNELRKLAQGYIQNERPDHTLQATALVHEAYIRLVDWEKVSWQNRAHFFGVAANVMRKILVDHARQKKAQKRNFGQRIELTENVSFSGRRDVDIIELNDALEVLAEIEPQQARIVELRFFGCLSIDETAHVIGISRATVKREWAIAKTWLYRKLKSE